jgi:ABC-type uncharacterized transport system ATPase component
MKLNFVGHYKSIGEAPGTSVDVADFIVLSGPNGSGKSNLLEAIFTGAITIDGLNITDQDRPQQIRFFRLGELLVQVGQTRPANEVRDAWTNLHNAAQMVSVNMSARSMTMTDDERESQLHYSLIQEHGFTSNMLDWLVELAGKRLIEFTQDDFRRHSPLLVMSADPFSVTLIDLFVTYNRRRRDNVFYKWCMDNGEEAGGEPLSPMEFEDRNGPPPWDLMNELLASMQMDYRFNRPVGNDENLVYVPLLRHGASGIEVQIDHLSSGEKTLLAVAMSLYTGDHLGSSIKMPKALLLDEADASLHPSMVKTLLDVTYKTFAQRHGVKVILTTHSPTTVALAPEGSLYVMRRDESPRLLPAARDDGLRGLMVGLPALRVSNDHRRHVFVEGMNDQECYQRLFHILQEKLSGPISLEFIGSSRDSRGRNNSEVIDLVEKLRKSGNEVLGVVDRDKRQGAPDGIAFLPTRYTLENLILDPVVVAIFLLQKTSLGTNEIFDAEIPLRALKNEHAQTLCNFVMGKVRQSIGAVALAQTDFDTTVAVEYDGGAQADVPKFALDMKGHDWEALLVNAFQGLEHLSADGRGSLKTDVVKLTMFEHQEWIPRDVRSLFNELLSLAQTNPETA